MKPKVWKQQNIYHQINQNTVINGPIHVLLYERYTDTHLFKVYMKRAVFELAGWGDAR